MSRLPTLRLKVKSAVFLKFHSQRSRPSEWIHLARLVTDLTMLRSKRDRQCLFLRMILRSTLLNFSQPLAVSQQTSKNQHLSKLKRLLSLLQRLKKARLKRSGSNFRCKARKTTLIWWIRRIYPSPRSTRWRLIMMGRCRSTGSMLTKRTTVQTCFCLERCGNLKSIRSCLAPSKSRVWREQSLLCPRWKTTRPEAPWASKKKLCSSRVWS